MKDLELNNGFIANLLCESSKCCESEFNKLGYCQCFVFEVFRNSKKIGIYPICLINEGEFNMNLTENIQNQEKKNEDINDYFMKCAKNNNSIQEQRIKDALNRVLAQLRLDE